MLCDTWMGGMAGEVQEGEDTHTHTHTHTPDSLIVQQKVTQHYKAIILQFFFFLIKRELAFSLCSPPGEDTMRSWESTTLKRALART